MPSYIFRLDNFRITKTRATFNDTDHVSFSLKVGDREFGPLIKHMGDVNDGSHLVNLELEPISVDTPATPVLINYQIINSGHGDNNLIEKALTDGAHTLAAKLLTSGSYWAKAAGAIIEILAQLDIFVVNCDGPVAIDQIRLMGADLENLTNTGVRSKETFYKGTDSDDLCGGNSEYYVTWSVVRVPTKRTQGSSGFLIQTTFGSKGNFELLVPHTTTGLAHYWRNNDAPALPWNGPYDIGSAVGHIDAVSLLQSNFGTPGGGNFELLARVGEHLVSFWRPDAGGPGGGPGLWQGPFDLVADSMPVTGVAGNPAFIQGRHGVKGNFELVVPLATGGLAHYWRDNDDVAHQLPWHRAQNPFPMLTERVDAVSLIESNFSTAGNGPGNLELVVRVGDRLLSFWRPDAGGPGGGPGLWQGPFDLVADGVPITGVAGIPTLIQGRHGVKGNFELVVPLAAGGLGHYWRDNDDAAGHLPWHRVQNPFPGFGERVDAVSLIESTFSAAGNGPGNLELVARIGDRLAHFSRPDIGGPNNTPGNWQGPIFFAGGV
jgi:hypothetical protein